MRVLFALLIMVFSGSGLSAQFESRDNYTGNWEDPHSWDPVWNSPKDTIYGIDIRINGFITLNGSLHMLGTLSDLWISDTLVIMGDLFLGNNCDLVIGDNGVLIVRGDIKVVNNTDILNRGYLIVTGDFVNISTVYGGSFITTNDPSKVFICGNVPAINNFFYPVLDCAQQTQTGYSHTNCNYGDITDLSNDSIYDFFRSTCKTTTNAGSNSPVCMGDTLKLSANGGVQYHWRGPLSFVSNEANPHILANSSQISGKYLLAVFTQFCMGTDTVEVMVNEMPVITAFANSPVCTGETIEFSANGAATFQWKGPDNFVSTGQNPFIANAVLTNSGIYQVVARSTTGCADSLELKVRVNEYPVADAGSDQVLENVFETRLHALSSVSDTGEWSLITGSGNIVESSSPVSEVNSLAPGQNVFRWHMHNGKCEATDDVTITVIELFIPDVITPNGDGKNDFFRIKGIDENTSLTIMNRWGVVEYESSEYKNDWNGYGTQNKLLPDDTYFYILRLHNGTIRKGSLLIKRQ